MSKVPPVTVSGAPHGASLLLIHPMGADRRFWDGCRALWDHDHRSIACDLPGAGDWAMVPPPYSFGQYVNALATALDRLRIERVVVVGCAIGAMIAARFAATHPERTCGAVLSNPGMRTSDAARAALTARAAAVRRGGFDAILPAAVDGAFAGCADDASKAAYVDRFRSQPPESYAATIEAMLDADISADLVDIECPMLLVPGGKDLLLPKDHAEQIRARVPAAEYHLIEDGAHFIPYQRPAQFAALVADFVARRCAR